MRKHWTTISAFSFLQLRTKYIQEKICSRIMNNEVLFNGICIWNLFLIAVHDRLKLLKYCLLHIKSYENGMKDIPMKV